MPTGADHLIAQLERDGVQHVFTVPGPSTLAVLNALHGHASVQPVTCRTDTAASLIAEATGRITGIPGVALVERGTGAIAALSGVYAAFDHASPLVLLVALGPIRSDGRDSFQSIDVKSQFAAVSKWTTIVSDAASVAASLSRAFRIAASGRPGPVVVGLTEACLIETSESHDGATPRALANQTPDPAALDDIREALALAERPLLIVGGGVWSEKARRDIEQFAEQFDLPTVTGFGRQDYIDNTHPCYAGNAGVTPINSVVTAMRAADVVLSVGCRLDDVTTQSHAVLNGDDPRQTIFLIGPDVGDPLTAHPSARAITASAIAASDKLAVLSKPGRTPPWGIWRRDLHVAYERSQKSRTDASSDGRDFPDHAFAVIQRSLPDNSIIASDLGGEAGRLVDGYTFREFPSQLLATSGTRGYALNAAIAAKLACPTRTVVAVSGDGSFQSTASELATAMQFGLSIIVVVINNRSLGMVRTRQEQQYPGRRIATSLMNPDFVALAESFGASGVRLSRIEDVTPAIAQAMRAGTTTLLEICTESGAI